MQGAVAPSTVPTNWQSVIVAGTTATVVGTGIQNGITYLDVRVNGTPSVSTYYNLVPDILVAGSSGQTWTGSFWASLIAGSLSNTSANIEIRESDAAQGFLTNSLTTLPITSTLTRYSQTRTLNNASTAFVSVRFVWQATVGLPVDFTLRIGLPQLELGAFATSVIPTTTTALTRNADVASMTGTNFSSWFNAAEGTLLAQVIYGADVNCKAAFINNGAYTNLFSMQRETSLDRWQVDVFSGGSRQALLTFATNSAAINSVSKCASAYKVNDFSGSVNGGTVVTDTSGLVPVSMDRLALGRDNVGSAEFLNGWLQRISYYPVRLPNSTLQALTV
jgi:hypothetical protein